MSDLEDALAAWRGSRSPVVAEAVEALSAEALDAWTPPKGRTSVLFHAAWMALAADADAVAVGWLARTLRRKVPLATGYLGHHVYADDALYVRTLYGAALERVAAIERYLPDPRLAAGLVEVVSRAPWPCGRTRMAPALYGPMLAALEAAGDPRQAAVLRDLRANPRSKQPATRAYLDEALPGVIAALSAIAVGETGPEWAAYARPSALTAGADARSEEQLLAAILAAPHDDAPRLVYADLLAEVGDPRGEFIRLQLDPDPDAKADKRMRSLQRKHQKAWLGDDLHAVLAKVVFERGFLAEADLRKSGAAVAAVWKRAAVDPRLATLHTLRRGSGALKHYLALLANCPAARHAEASSLDALAKIFELPQMLVSLTIRTEMPTAAMATLADAPSLARLEVLDLTTSEHPDEVVTALEALLPRLRELALGVRRRWGDQSLYRDAFRLWPRLPATIERLVMEDVVRYLQLQRVDGGVRVIIERYWPPTGEAVSAMIDDLPADLCELVVWPISELPGPILERLRAELPAGVPLRIESAK